MISIDLLEAVCDRLYTWHAEGRNLPDYKRGFGKAHLYWLLTGEHPPGSHFGWLEVLYETMTEDCARGLLSQHGWCIYQVLLARRDMKEETS